MQKSLVIGLMLASSTLLVAGPAAAYVLPADFLGRLWASTRRVSLRDATLTLVHTKEGEDKGQDGRLYFKRPERLRWSLGEDNEQVRIVNEGQGAEGSAQALLPTGRSDDLLALLMVPKGKDLDEMSARVSEGLTGLGIDGNTTTFGRHADGVAYIVGAHSWEKTRPQIWFDKVSFYPVRLIWPRRSGETNTTTMRQVRLLKWQHGWPHLLEWYDDERLIERTEISRVAVNTHLPETLFDLSGAGERSSER